MTVLPTWLARLTVWPAISLAVKLGVGGPGRDPRAAEDVAEAQDPVAHQLGVSDDVGGVVDDSRQRDPVVGKLDVLPDPPLVLVADIAGLERIGPGVDREHDIDDVAEGDV